MEDWEILTEVEGPLLSEIESLIGAQAGGLHELAEEFGEASE